MRLDQPHLAVLIKDTERISFCFEYHANSLKTRRKDFGRQKSSRVGAQEDSLQLYKVMKLVFSNLVCTYTSFCSLPKIFGEDRNLHTV